MRSFILLLFWMTAMGMNLGSHTPEERLEELFEDDWEFQMRTNPFYATSVGDHRFNDRLPLISEAAYLQRKRQEKMFLSRLLEINRQELSAESRINYDIFERLKNDRIREYEFRSYLLPITNRSGFHVSFPELGNRMPFNNTRDYNNYISRLKGFPEYVDGHIALMRTGMEQGYVLPLIVLHGVDEIIKPHIVETPEESMLYGPYETLPSGMSAAEKERLKEQAREVIMQSVIPGFRRFLDFMVSEYLPAAREEIAISSIPDGEAYYQHRVNLFTTLEISPEEIHRIGLSEVKRIRGEMDEIILQTGFEGTFEEFVDFLRTDDQFYVETPEELLKEVAFIKKKMDGEMPRLFKTLPRMPYGIRAVPDYIAPRTTTAYYMSPSGDGTRAGFYYVNTYDLRSRPLYELEALSLHEAVPGHHHQIALQQELEDLPNFRRYAGFTVFVEGWALYAERLGLEVGFYQDPYSDFGRLTYEIWRALRLVVDPGMHALGWSRQQAIYFMAENSALTLHNITTEVDRYISWPGQALAYKTGELKIRELLELAESKLGENFDIREFHDVVLLSGAVPLDVLENNVINWIEENK